MKPKRTEALNLPDRDALRNKSLQCFVAKQDLAITWVNAVSSGEAYVRLVDGAGENRWNSRGHFFAAAAEAMRRILIDRARAKNRPKHGGDRQRMELEFNCPAGNESPDRLLAIDEAFERLQSEHPHVAELLKLRYFAGVPLKDAAELPGISPATAKRRWAFARRGRKKPATGALSQPRPVRRPAPG